MTKQVSLYAFIQLRVSELRDSGKIRTAETYSTTMNSIKRYLNGKDVPLRQITAELVNRYENWLLTSGVSRNTSSFYIRILRSVYNQAADRGFAPSANPFRHVYTGVDKTRKRAVSLDTIRRIKKMYLSYSPALSFARDMFLFSFYTRGMSFVDMAYLRRSDVHKNVLTYARNKTGQTLSIRWEECMQEIVDRYPENPNGFLLPIITRPGDYRNQYRNVLFKVNSGLKEISQLLNLPVPLTTYVARHSWASIAYSQSVPLSVITEGLGHDSERTTRIYLASVLGDKVDRANQMIIDLL